MNHVAPINSFARTFPVHPQAPSQWKKWALIALSTILALGMIFSYMIGAPWFVVFLFFACALAPLFPLRNLIGDQNKRISEKQPV